MAWAAPRLAGHSTPVSLGQQRLVSREHGGLCPSPPKRMKNKKASQPQITAITAASRKKSRKKLKIELDDDDK